MNAVNAPIKSDGGDDFAWAERSDFWQGQLRKITQKASSRAKPAGALTLGGHGVSMRIEGGCLTIQNGFTHYPQPREIIRYFRGDVSLPETIILLDGKGSVTFDVLSWLAEQNVSLVRLDWRGEIVCVSSSSGYAANPNRVRWQLETRDDRDQRAAFCRSIIIKKLEASIMTLERGLPRSTHWNMAYSAAAIAIDRMRRDEPSFAAEVRLLEANCAAAYFRCWRGLPLQWRENKKRPIPDSWRMIEPRCSPRRHSGGRNAAHPVNAILNYGYAVLESEMRIRAIKDGFDPTIGIMHEGTNGSSKYVFDIMEPERPKVDFKVLEFVKNNIFDPADFTIQADGVCRLNPQLARVVAALVQTR